jgi:hypothetical protein
VMIAIFAMGPFLLGDGPYQTARDFK